MKFVIDDMSAGLAVFLFAEIDSVDRYNMIDVQVNSSVNEEVMMLTKMAFESQSKSYWFDPNEDFADRLARDVTRATGLSSVSIASEIRRLASPVTYLIHNHRISDAINEIARKSIEMPKIKEVPHYRDLEYKNKKKRF